jgi:hypothetical protein
MVSPHKCLLRRSAFLRIPGTRTQKRPETFRFFDNRGGFFTIFAIFYKNFHFPFSPDFDEFSPNSGFFTPKLPKIAEYRRFFDNFLTFYRYEVKIQVSIALCGRTK